MEENIEEFKKMQEKKEKKKKRKKQILVFILIIAIIAGLFASTIIVKKIPYLLDTLEYLWYIWKCTIMAKNAWLYIHL